MVHGPGVLLAFAGYSLTRGVLNDLQSFNLSSNTWSLVEVNQLESSIPSARYLHTAVFYIVSISNNNWTEWSTIQGVIARVISKSDKHEGRDQFEITSTIIP